MRENSRQSDIQAQREGGVPVQGGGEDAPQTRSAF